MSDLSQAVAVEPGEQRSMFDLSGREFNAMWVDEKQPLFIANNPLHWKAHKLQILIARLDKQAEKNAAQFNSANYIAAVNELEKCMEKINDQGELDALHDESGLGEISEERSDTVGARNASGLDTGVSADNPFAG